MSHINQDKKFKKKQEKKIDMSFQLKCVKKVTEAIMLLFFVDQVNCSAGAVNKDRWTLAAKATEGLCYLILHDTCNAEEI